MPLSQAGFFLGTRPNYAFKRTAGRGFDVSSNVVAPRPLNAALCLAMNAVASSRPSAAWWLYLVFFVLVSGFSIYQSTGSAIDFALSIISAFGAAGLWGYIQQAAVGSRKVWVAYFWVSVGLSVLGFVQTLRLADGLPPFPLMLFALVTVTPLYLALWRYAFSSEHIWSSGET